MGTNDGRHISLDEYGHSPRYPSYQNEKRREKERETFEEGKREWAKRRVTKPLAQTLDFGRENTVYDRLVREYLQAQGLVAGEEPTPEP